MCFGDSLDLLPQQLKQFWKWLRGIKMSTKVVCSRLLLIHRAIQFNVWMKGVNVDNMCPFCINVLETTKHGLWSFDFAIEV